MQARFRELSDPTVSRQHATHVCLHWNFWHTVIGNRHADPLGTFSRLIKIHAFRCVFNWGMFPAMSFFRLPSGRRCMPSWPLWKACTGCWPPPKDYSCAQITKTWLPFFIPCLSFPTSCRPRLTSNLKGLSASGHKVTLVPKSKKLKADLLSRWISTAVVRHMV